MQFPAIIRGFRPRPYKNKNGVQKYAGTFVLLDMSPRPMMATVELERDFDDEASMARALTIVGKQAEVVVDGLKVGIDGEARLVGSIELAKDAK